MSDQNHVRVEDFIADSCVREVRSAFLEEWILENIQGEVNFGVLCKYVNISNGGIISSR